MKTRTYSIHDIARLAGVSPSAVSYVLHNKPGVSEETRKRVKGVLRQCNYTGHPVHTSGRSFRIYLVIDNRSVSFDDMFYTSAMMGILDRCRRYDYEVVLTDITADESDLALKRSVERHNIDGAIFFLNIRDETNTGLSLFDVPFVVLDTYQPIPGIPCVSCDYAMAAKRAVDYLIAAGHRRIAYVGRSDVPEYNRAIQASYRQSLENAGLVYEEAFCASAENDAVSCALAARRLLSGSQRPDAVFCAGDMTAIYVMQYLQNENISVPGDISICSVDNISAAQYCSPPLTTVDIDKKKMGECAVDMLMAMIEHGKTENTVSSRVLSPGRVVERASVRRRETLNSMMNQDLKKSEVE